MIGLFFWTLTVPTLAKAVLTYDNAGDSLKTVAAPTGFSQTDIKDVGAEIVKSLFGVLGLTFFVLIIYAGIKWMTARGDEEVITKARDTIFAAVIGLSVILASYAITNFITTRILNGVSETTSSSGSGNGGTMGGEPLGCCTDWGPGADFFAGSGVPAYRITTLSDCQLQGDAPEPDGYSCVGPKQGCWTFQTGVSDIKQCQATN